MQTGWQCMLVGIDCYMSVRVEAVSQM